jgi:hypothetical protein
MAGTNPCSAVQGRRPDSRPHLRGVARERGRRSAHGLTYERPRSIRFCCDRALRSVTRPRANGSHDCAGLVCRRVDEDGAWSFCYGTTLGWSIAHNQVPFAWRRATSTVTTPLAKRVEVRARSVLCRGRSLCARLERPVGHQALVGPANLVGAGRDLPIGQRQHRVGFVECDQAVDVAGVEPLDDEAAQVLRAPCAF